MDVTSQLFTPDIAHQYGVLQFFTQRTFTHKEGAPTGIKYSVKGKVLTVFRKNGNVVAQFFLFAPHR